jgi:nucleoside-diphosphate-sugar epimerase
LQPVIILGCGFTGVRAAKLLLLRGHPVTTLVRDPAHVAGITALGADVRTWSLTQPAVLPSLDAGAFVIHSVPDIPDLELAVFRAYLKSLRPARVLYLSTTGVYGRNETVNSSTSIDPFDEKSARRVAEENFTLQGEWSSIVLRPAAIYGPGRGVHVHIRNGREPRSQSGMVSRIHVDDLAAIAVGGLLSDVTGAWPVADAMPASSAEVAAYCRELYRMHPAAVAAEQFAIAGRRVDASGILSALGMNLQYPDYRSGILACLAQESPD